MYNMKDIIPPGAGGSNIWDDNWKNFTFACIYELFLNFSFDQVQIAVKLLTFFSSIDFMISMTRRTASSASLKLNKPT